MRELIASRGGIPCTEALQNPKMPKRRENNMKIEMVEYYVVDLDPAVPADSPFQRILDKGIKFVYNWDEFLIDLNLPKLLEQHNQERERYALRHIKVRDLTVVKTMLV
jgi:hypothetical protein